MRCQSVDFYDHSIQAKTLHLCYKTRIIKNLSGGRRILKKIFMKKNLHVGSLISEGFTTYRIEFGQLTRHLRVVGVV